MIDLEAETAAWVEKCKAATSDDLMGSGLNWVSEEVKTRAIKKAGLEGAEKMFEPIIVKRDMYWHGKPTLHVSNRGTSALVIHFNIQLDLVNHGPAPHMGKLTLADGEFHLVLASAAAFYNESY